jgi:hypothetical protein
MQTVVHGVTCASYASQNCGATCRRKLQEAAATAPTFLVLDDLFYDQQQPADDGSGGHRRILNPVVYSVSEAACIAAKATLYQAVLGRLSDIATSCANLVLSTNNLQCLVVVHPA